jgi:hypothetical protein
MLPNAETIGSIIFVQSYNPPRPTSIITISQLFSKKYKIAIDVKTSKRVRCLDVLKKYSFSKFSNKGMYFKIEFVEMGTLFICTHSVDEIRCGEINFPTV